VHLLDVTYGGEAYVSGTEVDPGKELQVVMRNNVAGTNVEIPLELYIDGVASTLEHNKTSWRVENTEYKRLMKDSTATMATFDKLTTSTIDRSFGIISADTTIRIEYYQLTPVYRLYNRITSEHLYTTNKTEYDNYEKLCKQNKEYWIGEGIDWLATTIGTTVYRLYNPSLGKKGHSSHYYTTSEAERQSLKGRYGWQDDFNGEAVFYSGGGKAIYTCYNEALGSTHHLTSSLSEYKGLVQHGWDLETVKNLRNGNWEGFLSGYMGVKSDEGDTEDWSGDIMIGAFTISEDNWTNTMYYSNDGTFFRLGSKAYEDPMDGTHMYSKADGYWHYAMTCPSIIYRDGYFWMLSSGGNWLDNGNASIVISCSKDFKTWTTPYGFSIATETSTLLGQNQVAPEWFLDEDTNELYIIQSMGDYGDFSGAGLGNDKMKPYVCKVETLSTTGIYYVDTGLPYPQDFQATFSTFECMESVVKAELSTSNNNLIDGSMYKENGQYYFIIKKKGVINDIFVSSNPMGDNWKKVNTKDIAWGYEAPSLVKFNNQYMLYVDGVLGTLPVGTKLLTSNSISSGYSTPYAPVFMNDNGNTFTSRHGSVFVLKKGSAGWTQLKESLGLP
jgi:hypothetical protein